MPNSSKTTSYVRFAAVRAIYNGSDHSAILFHKGMNKICPHTMLTGMETVNGY